MKKSERDSPEFRQKLLEIEGISEYKSFDLSGVATQDQFFSDKNHLSHLVAQIVRNEGPIHKELLEKREFHNEGDIEMRKKRYEDRSDFLQTFINEFTEESFGSHIIKGDFKRKLDGWCKERGHRYMADNTLGKKMKEKEIETHRKSFEWLHDGKGGQLAVWDNIRWKE